MHICTHMHLYTCTLGQVQTIHVLTHINTCHMCNMKLCTHIHNSLGKLALLNIDGTRHVLLTYLLINLLTIRFFSKWVITWTLLARVKHSKLGGWIVWLTAIGWISSSL